MTTERGAVAEHAVEETRRLDELAENTEPDSARDNKDGEEPAPDDTEHDAESVPRSRRWRWPALVALLGLVAAALAAASVWSFLHVRDQRSTADARTQTVAVARQKVLDLLTLSQSHAKDDVARVQQGTTGEFKAQFSQQTAAWEQVLTQGKVESTGQIQESGFSSLSGDTAQVMVAASATVKNAQSPDGEARQYRMMVTVQRVDGQWLVSKLEFVP